MGFNILDFVKKHKDTLREYSKLEAKQYILESFEIDGFIVNIDAYYDEFTESKIPTDVHIELFNPNSGIYAWELISRKEFLRILGA